MITFGAKYISPVQIGKKINKTEVVPYEAAIVEMCTHDLNDASTLSLLPLLFFKKRKYVESIYWDFIRDYDQRNRYIALTHPQESYECIKPRNILGLIEFSSDKFNANGIYIEYLQAVKNVFCNNMRFVGTALLNYVKQIYSSSNIELTATAFSKNFYLKNGFEELYNVGDGLTLMRYSQNQDSSLD